MSEREKEKPEKDEEFTIRCLHVEFADGSIMTLKVEAKPFVDAKTKEESPCCRLCGWNPKFGEMRDLCFCTMGKHFRIVKEPRKIRGGNGS